MTWKLPTLKDELDKARAAERKALSSPLALEVRGAVPENPAARCPNCGRTTSADVLADVRSLTTAKRKALGFKEDTTHACDACRERAIATGKTTRAAFYESLGAPAGVTRATEAREARRVVSMSKPAKVVKSKAER